MLSPATFIGIANAVGQSAPTSAPARPAVIDPAASPAHAPAHQAAPASGRSANVQQARILTTPPVAAPIVPPLSKGAATATPAPPVAPPRNLPRGSLLDLSV
jgi:hypothetical protein